MSHSAGYQQRYFASPNGRAKVYAGTARYRATEKGRLQMRNQQLRKYGLDVDGYDVLLAKQGGGCALCGAAKSKHGARLAVDHDHATGRVRGLLCMNCNRKLGSFGDDPAQLIAAAEYLQGEGLCQRLKL